MHSPMEIYIFVPNCKQIENDNANSKRYEWNDLRGVQFHSNASADRLVIQIMTTWRNWIVIRRQTVQSSDLIAPPSIWISSLWLRSSICKQNSTRVIDTAPGMNKGKTESISMATANLIWIKILNGWRNHQNNGIILLSTIHKIYANRVSLFVQFHWRISSNDRKKR